MALDISTSSSFNINSVEQQKTAGIKRIVHRAGNFFGRTAQDWSTKTMITLGITGVVGTCIGALANSAMIIAFSIVCFVAGIALGIYRTNALKPKKDLETTLGDLKAENEGVETENNNLGENIRNLSETTKALKETNTHADKTKTELEQMLEKRTNKLEKVSLRLQETLEKLHSVEETFSTFEGSLAHLASTVGESRQIYSKLHNIVQEYQTANSISKDIEERRKELIEQLQTLNSNNGLMACRIKTCQEEMESTVQELRTAIERQRDGFEKRISDLKEENKKFRNSTQSLATTVERLRSTAAELEEAFAGLVKDESIPSEAQ